MVDCGGSQWRLCQLSLTRNTIRSNCRYRIRDFTQDSVKGKIVVQVPRKFDVENRVELAGCDPSDGAFLCSGALKVININTVYSNSRL